mgnify:CR=1 FL=1
MINGDVALQNTLAKKIASKFKPYDIGLRDLNLNIQKNYSREVDISHLNSLENICLFLSNQIEESHTKSSDFDFEAKKNLKHF